MLGEDVEQLEHGGALLRAARHYGIAPEQWVDLSTGVNPNAWPVPTIGIECWQRLPQEEDGLVEAARLYYGTPHLIPVAGSQAAIQTLPRLRRTSRVGLLSPAYAEHEHAWRMAGHETVSLDGATIDNRLEQIDVLVLINPNNPTGERFTPERLLHWHRRLVARGGWLVVDEAFIDVTPGQSLAAECGREGLIVLRSLGKFFGLAGARVGFVLAWPQLLLRLQSLLGPWSVSGPSREVARLALEDYDWQQRMRRRLLSEGERLAQLLWRYGLSPRGGTALFQYCPGAASGEYFERFAAKAVLLREFEHPAALRFGLPAGESQWQRLEAVLAGISGDSAEARVCQ